MRCISLILIAILTEFAHARLSSFNEVTTLRVAQQGVTLFGLKDIDLDGDLDWVTQNRVNGEIAIMFNNQYGKTSSILRTISILRVHTLDLGDADGDSIADILIGGESGVTAYMTFPANLSVVYAGKDRLFQDSVDITTGAEVMAARFVDVNGDKRNDILAALGKTNSEICWFEDSGSGWKKHIIDQSIGNLGLNSWITTADLDNDGKLDIIHGNYSNSAIIWYRNSGGGAFTKTIIASNIPVGSGTAVDIDLDGDLDIINGKLILYQEKGDFAKETISDPPEDEADFTDAGDVNNDGYPDIVASVWSKGVYLWQSIPGKKFNRILINNSSDPKAVQIGDADFDRFNDIVFISQTAGVLRCARNSGVFAFEPIKLVSNLSLLTGFDIADADNDGDMDFFVTQRQSFRVYDNRGDSLMSVFSGHCESFAAVQVGDFTGDGKVDFVLDKSNPAVWYEQSTFPQFTQRYLPKELDPVRCIDLNRDGRMEITGGFLNTQKKHYVVAYSCTGEDQYSEDTLYEGTFRSYYFSDLDNDDSSELTFYETEYDASNRYVNYDINHDKKVEVLYFVADSGNFGIKYNCVDTNSDGKSDLIRRNLMNVARREGDIAGGDLDSDSLDDIIIANDNNLYWISQTTPWGFPSIHLISRGGCSGNIKIVDFDKDGWKDILCRDSNDIMLYRNLLGVSPATIDIPVRNSLPAKYIPQHLKAPHVIRNGVMIWELPGGVKNPEVNFFLVNGTRVNVPFAVEDNRLLADLSSCRSNLGRVLVWAITDDNSLLIGKGMFSALK